MIIIIIVFFEKESLLHPQHFLFGLLWWRRCVSIFFSNITLLLEISARRVPKKCSKLQFFSALYLPQTRSSWMMISYRLISVFLFLAYLNKTKVSVVIVVLAIAPSYSTCTLTKKLLQHVHLSSRESDDDKNDKNIVMQLKGLLLYFLVNYHRKKMSHFLSRGNH